MMPRAAATAATAAAAAIQYKLAERQSAWVRAA